MKRIAILFAGISLPLVPGQVKAGIWWEYGWDRVAEALSTGGWLPFLYLLLEAF